MTRTTPPFRADQVGSFLRPKHLLEARAKRELGELPASDLAKVEDAAIEKLVAKQKSIGLQAATDGEFRRTFWHLDFLEEFDGVERYEASQGIQFKGGQTKAWGLKVRGKLDFSTSHPMLQHFRFLQEQCQLGPKPVLPKMTIPSPSVLHFRGGRKAVSTDVYPGMDAFYHDLGEAYLKAVNAFAAEGCRYLQLDEVNFTYLCDPDQREMLSARGDDPAALPDIYAAMINKSVSEIPSDMTITMHLCRGNFKSMWIGSGGYEPVAELLFNGVNVHGYFMEYDTERAGGFEPLRFVPKDKLVVLGLVTSKHGTLESKDELKRRIDEAAKFISLDQLCLSPQCGFASTEEGNVLTEDEQWAKIARVIEVAHEVWG
jgi:5-methyltetrahydropteroyltriglutamate--homocysteine methyltransferase